MGLIHRLVVVCLAMLSLRISWRGAGPISTTVQAFTLHSRAVTRGAHQINTESLSQSFAALGAAMNDPLLKELKDWRRRTANEMQRPVFQVLPNQVLENIAALKPDSLDKLSTLSGIGPVKLHRYGNTIIDIVQKYPRIELDGLVDSTSFWATQVARKNRTSKSSSDAKTTRKSLKSSLATMSAESRSALDSYNTVSYHSLNDEKKEASKHILRGQNVFVSGSAGTGKSFLLRYVIQELIKRHGEDAVAVTAPTGIAAINVNGMTVHGFAGIGLGHGDTDKLIQKVLKNKLATERWRNCKVLIIDEVSMLERRLFEQLDEIARFLRNSDEPFGGIKLILVGDFLQLPPVQKGGDKEFAFQSPLWEAAGLHLDSAMIYLEKVERQTDPDFARFLNEVRLGVLSRGFQERLLACQVNRKPLPTGGIIPTKLYAINAQVDKENTERLNELPGEVITISAVDQWKERPVRSADARALIEGVEDVIPSRIDLKVGAQVMLLRNRARLALQGNKLAKGPSLVNGSRGKIISFTESVTMPGMTVPVVEFDNGLRTTIGPVEFEYFVPGLSGKIVRFQLPLKLAWATTVHKSQGSTLTCAQLMLDRVFDFGQVYVALSRVTNLDGLWLSTPILPRHVKANPLVLDFYGYETPQAPPMKLG